MKSEPVRYESPLVKVVRCETEGVFIVSKSERTVEYTEEIPEEDGWW